MHLVMRNLCTKRLTEGWGLDDLIGEHASLPYNPNVANAFFRAGEIEAWGRGIQRIFQACRDASTPKPRVRLAGHDLWLEFNFARAYLQAVSPISGEPSTEADGKSSVKTSVKILQAILENAEITIPDLADRVGITTRSVERNIRKLQEEKRLCRIGPDKGGHWEVLK
jgi:ATP-dependent DNA helicase RecG